ncbi:MAG: hypothetical protein R3F65_18130 [bacterium]
MTLVPYPLDGSAAGSSATSGAARGSSCATAPGEYRPTRCRWR